MRHSEQTQESFCAAVSSLFVLSYALQPTADPAVVPVHWTSAFYVTRSPRKGLYLQCPVGNCFNSPPLSHPRSTSSPRLISGLANPGIGSLPSSWHVGLCSITCKKAMSCYKSCCVFKLAQFHGFKYRVTMIHTFLTSKHLLNISLW